MENLSSSFHHYTTITLYIIFKKGERGGGCNTYSLNHVYKNLNSTWSLSCSNFLPMQVHKKSIVITFKHSQKQWFLEKPTLLAVQPKTFPFSKFTSWQKFIHKFVNTTYIGCNSSNKNAIRDDCAIFWCMSTTKRCRWWGCWWRNVSRWRLQTENISHFHHNATLAMSNQVLPTMT